MEKIRMELVNSLDELHKVNKTLEQLREKWKLEMSILMNLNLCLEEALTNIIFYAYEEKDKYPIIITFEHSNERSVSIILEDKGKAFNPLRVKNPDLNADVKNRKIGSLGVFFIKNFMDEVEYTRSRNTNRLRMLKRI